MKSEKATPPRRPQAMAKPSRTTWNAELASLDYGDLEAMLSAGEEIAECYRVLQKAGLNIVGEVLKAQGQFVQMTHYPQGDVYDRETHSQYYYHAHRSGEHGHFHTFLRQQGMPGGTKPIADAATRDWPKDDQALSHLIAISMDRFGFPIGLFTTNRWVTGETWYAADDVCSMLRHFSIDHAFPSWPANRWLTAMVRLFRPQIDYLIRERDRTIQTWGPSHSGVDVFEDRNLEVTSQLAIDVDLQVAAVRAALSARSEISGITATGGSAPR